MSRQRLPEFISPCKLARQRQQLRGQIDMASLRRLQALTTSPGVVEFQLDFEVDDQRIPMMRGHIKAKLMMACQRCLKDTTVIIDRDVEVGFVFDDAQAAQVSSRVEVCTLTEDHANLAELVEDEVILALPVVALHEDGECTPLQGDVGEAIEDGDADKENPFAVLRELKSKARPQNDR